MNNQTNQEAIAAGTVLHGIRIPQIMNVVRGYLRGESGLVVGATPNGLGGYKWTKETAPGRVECGPHTTLPAVTVMLQFADGRHQTYSIARNDDGIVSEFVEAADPTCDPLKVIESDLEAGVRVHWRMLSGTRRMLFTPILRNKETLEIVWSGEDCSDSNGRGRWTAFKTALAELDNRNAV